MVYLARLKEVYTTLEFTTPSTNTLLNVVYPNLRVVWRIDYNLCIVLRKFWIVGRGVVICNRYSISVRLVELLYNLHLMFAT